MGPRTGGRGPADRGWRLLYDGDCRFCQWSAWAILQADVRGVLEPLTFAEARARGAAEGLPEEELRGSYHLVAPDGRRWGGGEAIPLLARLLAGPLAAPFEAPAMRVLERRLYGWLARHRGALSRMLPPAPPVRRRRGEPGGRGPGAPEPGARA